jgi:hypothetical protein
MWNLLLFQDFQEVHCFGGQDLFEQVTRSSFELNYSQLGGSFVTIFVP